MTNWQSLLNPKIQEFVRAHAKDDVARLALKKPPNPDWPYALILDQIKARQKAAMKIPLWLDVRGVIFPPASIMEQASSAATAHYKAALVRGKVFADLTGGAGVDSAALAQHFDEGHIIDADENAAGLIAHNLALLSDMTAHVGHARAEEFIKDMPPADLAIIDPQRRDANKKGRYRFEDCSPNVLALLPTLREKARHIMIKTSPMLDIDEGVSQLGGVSAVHTLEWRGDCKELVFIIGPDAPENIPITAVFLDDKGNAAHRFTFTRAQEKQADIHYGAAQRYLYEPGPAFMKAGSFGAMAQRFNLAKLHPNTHLYSSDALITDFPGRIFEITDQVPAERKKLKAALGSNKANISVRNFPMSAAELAKKMGIKDGGDCYIFACAAMDEHNKERKILLLSRKIS